MGPENPSSNIPGGNVPGMQAALERMGAITPAPGTVTPPTASGVVAPTSVPAVAEPATPAVPGTVPQPNAVVGQPAPAPQPKNGEMVQGEVGPNGEPLVYVVHDGITSKMTISEMAADHSYKAHNTRVGQENADKRRDLDLRETKLVARETALLNAGGQTFDELISGNGAPGTVVPPVAAPPVVNVPPRPSVELAVENATEYDRQMAAHEAGVEARNQAAIAAAVQSAVQPLATQFEQTREEREAAEKQAKAKNLNDQRMAELKARIPNLDMNLVEAFRLQLPHNEAEAMKGAWGTELLWGRILRGERPGGTPVVAAPAATAPTTGYPPPTAYPASPAVPNPPFAEPANAGGRVAHAPPVAPGGAVPNMSTPEAIAQALKNKRAVTGPTVYSPEVIAR